MREGRNCGIKREFSKAEMIDRPRDASEKDESTSRYLVPVSL